MATGDKQIDMRKLTDCIFFTNGTCKNDDDKCSFRHCQSAIQQPKDCYNWPKSCRNVNCPYRHCGKPIKTPKPLVPRNSMIGIFWDIENVSIPKGQKPFDIVQRILHKLVEEPGLQLANFSCFCKIHTISTEIRESLGLANVDIVDAPGFKIGAADRKILLALDRFERVHRPPATVVLISGDIDFIAKLSDLRHSAGFTVIVIHNKPAREELKATVQEHYPWEFFTEPVAKSETQVNPSTQQVPSTANDDTKEKACPHCTNTYTTIEALNQHQKDKKHLFYCPICNEGFFKSRSLDQHQMAKNHLFYCPICNEKFSTSPNLEQHQKDNKHLFNCPVCNAAFSTLSTLEKHQKDNKHLFNCPVCNEAFSTLSSLEQHRKNIHKPDNSELNEKPNPKVHALIAHFEQNTNACNNNNRRSAYSNPVDSN